MPNYNPAAIEERQRYWRAGNFYRTRLTSPEILRLEMFPIPGQATWGTCGLFHR